MNIAFCACLTLVRNITKDHRRKESGIRKRIGHTHIRNQEINKEELGHDVNENVRRDLFVIQSSFVSVHYSVSNLSISKRHTSD